MRRIGEEVPPEDGGEYGRIIKKLRISTGTYHIIMSRTKMISFAFIFVFFLIGFLIIPLFMIDPAGMFILVLGIFAILGAILVFMLGLMALMMIPISKTILKGNRIYLTDKGVLVKHQFWISTPLLTNMVPYERIVDVERADEEYFEQVRSSTSAWKRFMYMGTPPPAGGLYHMYSNKEGLVILFLDKALTVNNMVWGKGSGGVPRSQNRSVKEVIVDIHPEDQDMFINEVKKRSSEGRKPRMVSPPPKH
ncbi:MAG: hypothetical protein ACMUHM_06795 [Thermoplasmatota archaeon]